MLEHMGNYDLSKLYLYYCLSFHILWLRLTILNLISFSRINLQWTLLAFPTLLSKRIFKLKRPLTEKLKFKHINGVFGMF